MKDIEISEEVRRATTKCSKDFCCLTEATRDLCPLESIIADKLFFIKPKDDKPCKYMESFGLGKYCTCPTRAEIYRKHKL